MLIRWIQSRVPWLIGLDRSSSFVRGRKLEPCNHSPICPNACQWIHKVKLTQDHGDKSNMYRINAFKDGPPIRSTITFEIIYFHPYTIIQKRENSYCHISALEFEYRLISYIFIQNSFDQRDQYSLKLATTVQPP